MNTDEILSCWFGELSEKQPLPQSRLQFWFAGAGQTDREIEQKFGHLLKPKGQFLWTPPADVRRCLALILCCDQFPRNIFRGTPGAFAYDARALQLSLSGIERGWDRQLRCVERAFFYLPLEHSEDRGHQERSVELFGELLREAPEAQKSGFESFLDYARRHREIIAQFGRFPHRNRILGRVSTPEERAFLKQPGSSF